MILLFFLLGFAYGFINSRYLKFNTSVGVTSCRNYAVKAEYDQEHRKLTLIMLFSKNIPFLASVNRSS